MGQLRPETKEVRPLNRYLRKTSAILLSVMLILLGTSFPVGAKDSGNNPEDKLSPALKEMLGTMDGGDQTDVSIWVSDIDRNAVKEETAAVMEDAAEEDEISHAALCLLDDSGDGAQQTLSRLARAEAPALFSFAQNKMQALPAEKTAQDVTAEEAQFFVETERAVSSALYEQKNAAVLQTLFPKQKQDLFRSGGQKQPEILYSCKYAPNIMLRLTKDEIYTIIEEEDVLEVYPYNPVSEPVEDEDFQLEPAASVRSYENLSTVWQDVTGISYLRDTLGKDGTGIKIGLLEHGAPDFSNTQGINCFTHMLDEEHPENSKIKNFMDFGYNPSHSTYCASLIVGKLGAYKGVVPNAELYCAGVKDSTSKQIFSKEGMETLISEGVNVINCSHYFSGGAYDEVNIYHDTAKWLDHISIDHHITIVLSSGNWGAYGIAGGNMSYNAIVVGDLDTKNTMDLSDDTRWVNYDKNGNEKTGSSSSYSDNTMLPFKPDLVAPGEHTACPYSPRGSGGTSSAAPVVTGAVAQLMQADPYLKTRPDLVKALLLCGTTHMAQQSTQNNDVPAMSRELGSGMLNVYNSFTALSRISYPKYDTGTYGYDESAQLHKTVLVNRPCDTVRIALTWNKTHSFKSLSVHHDIESMGMAPLSRLKLTVVTPDQKTYISTSMTGNVQLISLPSPKLGTYHIYVDRIYEFEHTTNFSIAVFNGDVMS